MYARYSKQRVNGNDHFKFIEEVCLFGCNEGFIPWLLCKQMSASQGEPYKWHISIESALAKTEYPGTLIIDLKPKQKKTNLSLYEALDVWGYSDAKWTPIMLRLSGLFVDVDPKKVNRHDFSIEDRKREGPIYEFLYLDGTVEKGKLKYSWAPPPASPTNAALLWPDTLKYFVDCIKQCTPGLICGG